MPPFKNIPSSQVYMMYAATARWAARREKGGDALTATVTLPPARTKRKAQKAFELVV